LPILLAAVDYHFIWQKFIVRRSDACLVGRGGKI